MAIGQGGYLGGGGSAAKMFEPEMLERMGAALGQIGQADAPVESTEGRTVRALAHGEKLASVLYERIQRIEGRLSFALRPSGPTGQATDKDPRVRTAPAPSVEAIEAQNQRLGSLIGYLEAIESRIDL
jgi:hypothetical protein